MTSREACPQGGPRCTKGAGTCTRAKRITTARCVTGPLFLWENWAITEEPRVLIERLFLERISLRESCRAAGSSGTCSLWLRGSRRHPEHLYIKPAEGVSSTVWCPCSSPGRAYSTTMPPFTSRRRPNSSSPRRGARAHSSRRIPQTSTPLNTAGSPLNTPFVNNSPSRGVTCARPSRQCTSPWRNPSH
jgi:hypothetical protein